MDAMNDGSDRPVGGDQGRPARCARYLEHSPEQLQRDGIEAWLRRPGRDFAEAAAYVLEKNRELYRRLA